ncbi:hypothetical protein ACQ4M3_24730 [Leptolyngbya sp. AN03gr2]|uniref:hypothetical protein n=1 Tax=unclassified Leptolyngbya TaxID=2650499 RepID=UPI003D324420
MSTCLCCSTKLLRHIRYSGVYWFCPSCRQEMPNLEALVRQTAIARSASNPHISTR